jgi:hypothetical protein
VLSDTDPDAAATIPGAVRTLAATIASPTANITTAPADTHAEASPTTPRGGMFIDFRREATHRVSHQLGDQRVRELRDHGTTMDTDHAVAYTLAHLDKYLARPDD